MEKQELEIESLSSEVMLIELEEKWLQWFGHLNRLVRARILKKAFDLIFKEKGPMWWPSIVWLKKPGAGRYQEHRKELTRNWNRKDYRKIEDVGSVDLHKVGMLLEECDGDEWITL
jgi:hypothetical protein